MPEFRKMRKIHCCMITKPNLPVDFERGVKLSISVNFIGSEKIEIVKQNILGLLSEGSLGVISSGVPDTEAPCK